MCVGGESVKVKNIKVQQIIEDVSQKDQEEDMQSKTDMNTENSFEKHRPVRIQSIEVEQAIHSFDKEGDNCLDNQTNMERCFRNVLGPHVQGIEGQQTMPTFFEKQLGSCLEDREVNFIEKRVMEKQPMGARTIEVQPITGDCLDTQNAETYINKGRNMSPQPIGIAVVHGQPIRKRSSIDSYFSNIEENSEVCEEDEIFHVTTPEREAGSSVPSIRIHTPMNYQNRKLEVTILIMLTMYLICFQKVMYCKEFTVPRVYLLIHN